jgi:hypothetical protein
VGFVYDRPLAPLALAEGHGNPVKGITVYALACPFRNCFGAAHVGQQTDPNPGKTKHLKISCKHLKMLSGTCSLFTLFALGKICAAHAGHCCVAGGKHALRVPCETVLALPIRTNAYQLPSPSPANSSEYRYNKAS